MAKSFAPAHPRQSPSSSHTTSTCNSTFRSATSKRSVQSDLGWLIRYARHCGLPGMPEKTDPENSQASAQALRSAFGAPAWRIVCRSPRSAFLPILRSRELGLQDLITYCQELSQRSFVCAPAPILLAFFIGQRRGFYDRPCRIPQGEDYDLMRVANRHHQQHRQLSLRETARVLNWAHQSGTLIQSGHKWANLLTRARQYFERERIRFAANDPSLNHLSWLFFCHDTDWRGWRVAPLTNAHALWQQGQVQGNCLYKLRAQCTRSRPSRFFSISRAGKNIATLELSWQPPAEHFAGMDRVWGKWTVLDLRLSFNRLPDQALAQSVRAFAQMYNTWAQRPGRHPPGFAQELRQHIGTLQSIPEIFQTSTYPTGACVATRPAARPSPRSRGSQYM